MLRPRIDPRTAVVVICGIVLMMVWPGHWELSDSGSAALLDQRPTASGYQQTEGHISPQTTVTPVQRRMARSGATITVELAQSTAADATGPDGHSRAFITARTLWTGYGSPGGSSLTIDELDHEALMAQQQMPAHLLTAEEAYRLYRYSGDCQGEVSTPEAYLEAMQRLENAVIRLHHQKWFIADDWLKSLDELEHTYDYCAGYRSLGWSDWNEQRFDWLTRAASGGWQPAQQIYYPSTLDLLNDDPELMIRRPEVIALFRQTAVSSLGALVHRSPESAWLQWSEAYAEGLIMDRDLTRSLASLMLASSHAEQPDQYDTRISSLIDQLDDARIDRAEQWAAEQMLRTETSTIRPSNL